MRVGCVFIIFVVNNLFESGFELKTSEEEDATLWQLVCLFSLCSVQNNANTNPH
jgi:hypothetical protein